MARFVTLCSILWVSLVKGTKIKIMITILTIFIDLLNYLSF